MTKLAERSKVAATVSFDVVLIDTSECFVVHIRNGDVVCERGKFGASHHGLATTALTLQALLDSQIDWAQATKARLVTTTGSETGWHDLLDSFFCRPRNEAVGRKK
jgi:hypothetical protein